MRIFLLYFLLIFAFSCEGSSLGSIGEEPPSHQLWEELLKKHVNNEGTVNYKGFIQDKLKLERYLKLLSDNAPDRNTWTKEEQLAYWINAYNGFTIRLIVDNYPVKSIQDLHPTVKIPLVNTVWHKRFFQIGGEDASLDEIEHKILRKEYEEPRIHFAINCASFSCPPLLNEAFEPEKLSQQLDLVAKKFINDTKRNKIGADQIEISPIFNWFKEDFTKKTTLIEYLNRYSEVKILPNAKISHMKYDWSLNE